MDMNPEVFERAGDRILRNGWVQHQGLTEDGKMCMGAAVQQEASIEANMKAVLGWDTYAVVEPYFRFLTKRLVPNLGDYHVGGHYIICWNDHGDRTQGEVVEALLAAGKALREEQQADMREEK
jgi:hypothetical protein